MVPKIRAALAGITGPGAEAVICDAAAPARPDPGPRRPAFGTRITAVRGARRDGMAPRRPPGRAERLHRGARSAGPAGVAAPATGPPRGRSWSSSPPGDRQPGGARRAASRARLRGHPGDGEPRHRRSRPGQGAARRSPRLRHAAGARRDDGRFAVRGGRVGRAVRAPRRSRRGPAAPDPRRLPGADRPQRPDPRSRQPARRRGRDRPGDRRVEPRRPGRDARRRQHPPRPVRRRARPRALAGPLRRHRRPGAAGLPGTDLTSTYP